MSDLEDLEDISESCKFQTSRKDSRGRKLGHGIQTLKGSKQPFAAAKRIKPKLVTLATEPYHPDNRLNKDRRNPKIIIDK